MTTTAYKLSNPLTRAAGQDWVDGTNWNQLIDDVNSILGVQSGGTLIGTRNKLNFIQGTNVTLTVADDAGNGRVNVTIAASGGGGSGITTAVSASGSGQLRSGERHKKITYSNPGFTPVESEIIIEPYARWGRTKKWWISDITTTSFVVHFDNAPSDFGIIDPVSLKVPLYYWNPNLDEWRYLRQLKKDYPRVQIHVVNNWNNGPDSASTADRITLSNNLKADGITLWGYVATDYGAGPQTRSSIDTQVANWISWYGVDGIFFDEWEYRTSELAADTTFYQNVMTDVKARNIGWTLANPGANVEDGAETFVKDVDYVLISEQQTLPGTGRFTSPSWKLKYSKTKWALDWHSAYWYDEAAVEAYFPYLGMITVTDDPFLPGNTPADYDNPWETLPSYLGDVVSHLDRCYDMGWRVAQNFDFKWSIVKRV